MAKLGAGARLTIAGALAALGGCGDSDADMRNEVREGVLSSCLEAGRGKGAPAGVDWPRMCGCVTDRLTEGRSGRELMERAPGEAERREAVALCRAEMAPARNAPAS